MAPAWSNPPGTTTRRSTSHYIQERASKRREAYLVEELYRDLEEFVSEPEVWEDEDRAQWRQKH